jgi:uncharacterized membrane protein
MRRGIVCSVRAPVDEGPAMFETRSALQRTAPVATGLLAAAITAGVAYLFDPRSGRRRRAILRDRLVHAGHVTQDFVGKANRDARHRMNGMYSGAMSRFRVDACEDSVVQERVRTELGRLSTHPGAIHVTCVEGITRLQGDILEEEFDRVLEGLRKVRGVQEIVSELRRHAEAGRIPSLQGNRGHQEPRFEYLQTNWSPAPRVLAGIAGASMIIAGAARRSAPGAGIALIGGALLGRSIGNLPLVRLFGLRSAVDEGVWVHKTIHVDAPPDEAYACWRNVENFPAFMSHVREIRKIDDARYHWKVDGPAGVPVGWDSQITADVPGELIAWKTVDGSVVQSAGVVQFEPASHGGTRIHVRMSYRPPANRVGHTVARLFGRDPKHQIDGDLMRFKTFIEREVARRGSESEVRH